MLEKWKVIKEAENYSISNLGRVMNNVTGKTRKLKVTQKGYNEITLTVCKGTTLTRRVHRLVAEEFIPKPAELVDAKGNPRDQVDHRDSDRLNNRVDNLRWCSNEENTDFRYGVTKEERQSIRDREEKEYKALRQEQLKTRQELAECREKEKRESMPYGSVDELIEATANPVKVDGIEYQSAREAAKFICEDPTVTAKVGTVRKELQKFINGKRPSWLMYGKYQIG